MGIPYYFKKVSSKFPSTLSSSNGDGCTRLFLDFNCAIHYCSNQLKKELGAAINNDFEDLLIARVLSYIDFLVTHAQPRELVYISMDGLAPRAKMAQQRNRRYISAYIKSHIAAECQQTNNDWDSNAISPGTTFMKALSTAITLHAANMSVRLILSDTTEVGEGEHKIMNFIKNNAIDNDMPIGDIIYGLDADLIMLALINQCNKGIRLMREPVFYDDRSTTASSAPFVYLDVRMLGNLVREHIALQHDIHDAPGIDAIAIYVFLCFFIGNDFLPHLTFIKLQEDGLETLLTMYKKTVNDLGGEHILQYKYHNNDRKYTIQFNVLWKLLEILSTVEDVSFNTVHEKYIKNMLPKINYDRGTPAQIEARLQQWPCSQNGKESGHAYRICPHEKGWRINYYHYLFASMGDVVTDACRNYIQGLQWLVDCYFHHNPQRGWYYKHVYSPTMLDLFNFLTCEGSKLNETSIRLTYINNTISIVQSDELDLQLLCILPPSSMHLIKPELHRLYKDVTKGCVHLFPQQFGFYSYLKRFLWECHPMIPVPNIVRLRKQINLIIHDA
jgi:5'-3' exoribonuclease 1